MANNSLTYDNYNVITVHWGDGASGGYIQSACNTRLVGLEVALLVNKLIVILFLSYFLIIINWIFFYYYLLDSIWCQGSKCSYNWAQYGSTDGWCLYLRHLNSFFLRSQNLIQIYIRLCWSEYKKPWPNNRLVNNFSSNSTDYFHTTEILLNQRIGSGWSYVHWNAYISSFRCFWRSVCWCNPHQWSQIWYFLKKNWRDWCCWPVWSYWYVPKWGSVSTRLSHNVFQLFFPLILDLVGKSIRSFRDPG